MLKSIRNRCKFGRVVIGGEFKTYEELRKRIGCMGFFWVKPSKSNQQFCDRFCQKNYRHYIKGEPFEKKYV